MGSSSSYGEDIQLSHYNNRKMMKQKESHHREMKETGFKMELVEGPPLDFSFKNIRVLSEILSITAIETKHPANEQPVKNNDPVNQQTSEKEIGEGAGETKLNIIRTIEVDENKNDLVKQLVAKKTEKAPVKVVKKTEVKTTSLFLRYNKLVSLQGFCQIVQQLLPNNKWEHLVWIDLSHNRLSAIGKEIQNIPQLKNLYLHVNFISNFKEFQNLKKAQLLRTFTIHGNPIENFPEFRVLISCILPQIQKLDSALLTKREKERGEVYSKQGMKYPIIQNPQKPPEQSQEEQQN